MTVTYLKKGIKTSKQEQRELSKIVKDILNEIENGGEEANDRAIRRGWHPHRGPQDRQARHGGFIKEVALDGGELRRFDVGSSAWATRRRYFPTYLPTRLLTRLLAYLLSDRARTSPWAPTHQPWALCEPPTHQPWALIIAWQARWCSWSPR